MERGDQLAGRYTLVERIGEGGMGEVWRAEQIALGRAVAIKLIHRDADEAGLDLAKRFAREAELAVRVEHRNVIDIIDFGTTEDGESFLVMPFLKGESLHARLRRAPPSLAEILRWARAILSGLAAIHEAGIVHRDLKPANVFLAEDADGIVPTLLDFGISRKAASAEQSAGAITQLGVAIGTPHYMAPEQFEAASAVDARADLYSVGVVLYQALAGRVPYPGDDAFAVYRAILSGEPHRLRDVRPELPPSLDALVHRAMARDREARFPSARAMRRALDEAVREGAIPGVTADLIAAGTSLPLGAMDDVAHAPTQLSPVPGPAPRRVAATAAMPGIAPRAATPVVPGDAQRATTPVPEVPASPRAATGGGAWRAIAIGIAVLGLGAGGWFAIGGVGDEPAATTPIAEPPRDAGAIPATGTRVSAPGALTRLALAWARLSPALREAPMRLVPTAGRWSLVTTPEVEPARASAIAAALGGAPTDAVALEAGAGLTPRLARVTVRLNVHTEPDIASRTLRVLPHDTLVVVLDGEHDAGISAAEGEDARAYFVVSEALSGWAVARYLAPATGCVPDAERLVASASGSPEAIRGDALIAETTAEIAGEHRRVYLMSARDLDARRSWVGIYAAGDACAAGDVLALHTLEGVIDEVFLTETVRPAGQTLLVVSTHPEPELPRDGVMDWFAFRLDDPIPVWRDRIGSAAFLGRRGGGVAGSRDRVLRRRPEDALSTRQPGGERRYLRWDGAALVDPAPPSPDPLLDPAPPLDPATATSPNGI